MQIICWIIIQLWVITVLYCVALYCSSSGAIIVIVVAVVGHKSR